MLDAPRSTGAGKATSFPLTSRVTLTQGVWLLMTTASSDTVAAGRDYT
jgi:hypothetical protein